MAAWRLGTALAMLIRVPGPAGARMRWLLLAALVATSCGAPGEPAPPRRILLVTLDTTRADRLGAYGYGRAQTPTLDALARDGILFERALATTPITLPSHASILTGVYPAAHGVRDNGIFALSSEATLISEILRERGWRTGAFTGAYVLASRFGLDQGFETYAEVGLGSRRRDQRPADEVVADAIAWLESLSPEDRFFAWVHFFDPHAPYDTHKPRADTLQNAYDAEIAFCDAQLARLLRYLEGAGLADGLLVAVTADHGEAFGAHGERTHGALLYDATLRVPLLLAGEPVSRQAGTRVARPVSHAQLAPTLLQLLGIPRTAMAESRLDSLLAADGGAAPGPGVLLESLLPFYSFGWQALLGIVEGRYKLIRGREVELYALDDDPEETRDLSAARPQVVSRLQTRLDALLERAAPLPWTDALAVDGGERALLAGLGYVAESARGGDPFDPGLPDPRERVIDLSLYQQAERFLLEHQRLGALAPPATAWQRDQRRRAGRAILAAARALLIQLLEADPGNLQVPPRLGVVERELGDLQASIAWLERGAAERPDVAATRYELALSYAAAGRRDDAVAQTVEALRLAPDDATFYEALVRWSIQAEDFGRAYGWLEAWSRLAGPASPEADRLRAALTDVGAEMRARGQRPIAPPELAAGEDG